MALASSKQMRTFWAPGAVASGSLPSTAWGSRGGTVRAAPPEVLLPEAVEAALVTRDSIRLAEIFRLLSTPETAPPLVYQRGAFCHAAVQEKAFLPTSSASTARSE